MKLNKESKAKNYKQMREDVLNDLSDPRHGTSFVVAWSYNCKCDKCEQFRNSTIKSMQADKNHELHGTRRGYVYGKCRCTRCTKTFFKADYQYRREKNWERIGIKNFTWEDFLSKLAKQNSKCAICGQEIGITAEVDHDHSNGKVRGIVCHQCNHIVRSVDHQLTGKKIPANLLVLAVQYIMRSKND